ncbi:unnamed protein product [Rotaria sordida]|uniref:General transcription factor TFIIB n=1 Tax=Rotaria sordida TaxID=392033 RepID=A0A814MZU4_9BILA|nr:unnamed protein product [Rotaria sordida]
MSRFISQLACRFHPEASLVEDSRAGDMICPECGLVVADRIIDVSSEWRTFSDDTNSWGNSRVGAAENHLLGSTNLETMIFSPKGTNTIQQPRQISTTDRALKRGYDVTRIMAGRLHLQKRVVDRACECFRQCYESKCVRGHSENAIVAACIYIACRKEGADRSLKEIYPVSQASKTEIGRCFSKIMKGLSEANRLRGIDVTNLIPRFCNNLNLDLTQEMHVRKASIYIVERAKDLCDIQSRAPSSLAAASIYLACLATDERKTLNDIEQVTDVKASTIRQVYKILRQHATDLFPSDFVFQCPPANLPKS